MNSKESGVQRPPYRFRASRASAIVTLPRFARLFDSPFREGLHNLRRSAS